VVPKISAPKLYVCQLYVWLERKRLMCVRENNSFGSALYSVFHSLLDDIMAAETVNNSRDSRGLASKIFEDVSVPPVQKSNQPNFQPLF